MRILADENCDRLIVDSLRKAGHDVSYVAEIARGEDDNVVFGIAQQQNRILLTDDLDFGRLAESAVTHPPAIVLMRLDPLSRYARAQRVVETLQLLGESLIGNLIVLESTQTRLRAFNRL
ncbi:MAG: DUF5615 family PIN-like protein [Proteobacteria bacterium]|nr:DUF5615 family PIN-like protein [Pseudomonadota bacterium]